MIRKVNKTTMTQIEIKNDKKVRKVIIMLFRKNIDQIKKEYKDLGIKNEDLEIYDEVKKIYDKSEKDNEKIGEKRDKQSNDVRYYERKFEKAKDRLKELKKEHKILTKVARIPLIGRFGKVAKEYRMLKAKMKRAKIRGKVADKAYKNLSKIYNKEVKDTKKTKRYLKKCEKSVRGLYRIDKENLKIARLYKNYRKILENIYGKSSLEYLEKYVAQVKEGEKEIELPEGLVSAKELAKKIDKDVKNRLKGKKEDITQIITKEPEEEENKNGNNEENKKENKEQNNNENVFARRGLDIKRDYVAYKEEINGNKIKLSPEETLNYIGFITKNPNSLENHSNEEILNGIRNDEKYGFVNRGWDTLHNMIEDLKDKNINIDVKTLSKSEKIVYKIAKGYIKKEQQAKEQAQQANEKDTQQVQGA